MKVFILGRGVVLEGIIQLYHIQTSRASAARAVSLKQEILLIRGGTRMQVRTVGVRRLSPAYTRMMEDIYTVGGQQS